MARLTMKFGGTSVGSPEAIAQVAEIVKDHLAGGYQLAVVVSAMSGVTDSLLESASAAADGDKDTYAAINANIADKHHAVIDALIASQSDRDVIRAEVDELLRGHLELCEAVSILGEATPRISDALVSYGERLSSRVIAAVMAAEGLWVKQVDSNDFIVTDNVFQNADPLWDETEARITDGLLPELSQGVTPIITGFIGATPDGTLTTLGRGGSDFSAAIFAAYLSSDELIIWTDVDGVMTADPEDWMRGRACFLMCPTKRLASSPFMAPRCCIPKRCSRLSRATFRCASAIPLIQRTRARLSVRAPRASETVIKAVTGIRDVSMLTVSGPGMLGVPGIAGRTFLATANAGASILMISQASSEQSFCFTVVDPLAQDVKAAVESELRREIQHNDINSVEVLSEIVIITVVGAGMRGTPGVAGRVFSLLGEHRINVLAIAQGSSECSISFIVAENDLERAVGELHTLALETVENDRVNGSGQPLLSFQANWRPAAARMDCQWEYSMK